MKKTGVPEGSGLLEINRLADRCCRGLIRDGIHRGLKDSGIQDLLSTTTPEWVPRRRRNGRPARSPLRNQIKGCRGRQ